MFLFNVFIYIIPRPRAGCNPRSFFKRSAVVWIPSFPSRGLVAWLTEEKLAETARNGTLCGQISARNPCRFIQKTTATMIKIIESDGDVNSNCVPGRVSKGFEKRLEEEEIRRIETIQTIALLRSARILRKVLESKKPEETRCYLDHVK